VASILIFILMVRKVYDDFYRIIALDRPAENLNPGKRSAWRVVRQRYDALRFTISEFFTNNKT
jgi:hypothetical protein